MSQKSNLITIRKNSRFLNLQNFNEKFFLLGYQFLTEFKQLLAKKNIVFLNEFFNLSCNKLYLNGSLFFKYSKIKILNRKKKLLDKKSKFLLLSDTKILFLFNNLKKFFKINIFLFNFNILNKKIKKELILFLFNDLKYFYKSLFSRRIGLFFDFLKLTTLCCLKLIKIDIFLKLISSIFCSLQKKSHSLFFIFITKLFNTLIFELKTKFKELNVFNGIKFLINGRIKGKPRANKLIIQKGKIPTQSIDKNLFYSSTHNYTPHYGVFGFKIWVLH